MQSTKNTAQTGDERVSLCSDAATAALCSSFRRICTNDANMGEKITVANSPVGLPNSNAESPSHALVTRQTAAPPPPPGRAEENLGGHTDRQSNNRSCWICLGTEKDNPGKKWANPCRCRGTMKWVHDCCLLQWIDQCQKNDPGAEVVCLACKTAYVIVLGKNNTFISFLNSLRELAYKICPYILTALCMVTLHCVAMAYSYITIKLICGMDKSSDVLETADPMVLVFGLPLIPLALIVYRMFSWEDRILEMWYKRSPSRSLSPSHPDLYYLIVIQDMPPMRICPRFILILSEALFLPTLGMVTGDICFRFVRSRLRRTLLGVLVFVLVKGVLQIYYSCQVHTQHDSRAIKNFEENTPQVCIQ